jgi:hypothetical protein
MDIKKQAIDIYYNLTSEIIITEIIKVVLICLISIALLYLLDYLVPILTSKLESWGFGNIFKEVHSDIKKER